MHLVEAASPRLVTLLSVTDDDNSYVAPTSSNASNVKEQEKSEQSLVTF